MSDNDLISREKLLHTLEGWLKLNARVVPTEIGKAVYMMIENYPAVPQEMSVREYVRERDRMCTHHNAFCNGCPALPERMEGGRVLHNCPIWTMRDPEKTVAIVEKWAREHPERSEDDGEDVK